MADKNLTELIKVELSFAELALVRGLLTPMKEELGNYPESLQATYKSAMDELTNGLGLKLDANQIVQLESFAGNNADLTHELLTSPEYKDLSIEELYKMIGKAQGAEGFLKEVIEGKLN